MLRMMRCVVLPGMVVLAGYSGAVWAGNPCPAPSAPLKEAMASKDIVDIASSADNFKTLTAALKAAGLIDTLKGAGPFTVFAPTDAAFAKLPKGTLEELLKPENKDKLTAILTYHVVPGKVTAADVGKLLEGGKTADVKTVNGATLHIAAKDGQVMIDNATVTKTDIMASNGVIHVIDTVVLPKEGGTADAK